MANLYRWASVTVVGLLLAVYLPLPAPAGAEAAGRARTGESVDMPAWAAGTKWVYHEKQQQKDTGALGVSDLTIEGDITYTIVGRAKVTVVGSTYDVYVENFTGTSSITGTVPGVLGAAPVSGTDVRDGYNYIRVSDLATVKTYSHDVIDIVISDPFLGDLTDHQVSFSNATVAPPEEDYDFPLTVADVWNLSFTTSTTVELTSDLSGQQTKSTTEAETSKYSCPSKMNKNVPAGPFDTYLVSARGVFDTGDSSSSGGVNKTLNYSPVVNNSVYGYIERKKNNGDTAKITIELKQYLPAAQALAVTANLTPSLEAPGNSVNLTGKVTFAAGGAPAPGAVVSATFPDGATANWSAVADAQGGFAMTIALPGGPDDTPTGGYDYGSHGLVVNATSGGSSGFTVVTATTALPDFDIASDGVTIEEGTTPTVGAPVSVNATVKNSGRVSSPAATVRFMDGAIQIGNDTAVPSMPPGGTANLTATWRPTLEGNRKVEVWLDPANSLIEVNESNNRASITVAVSPARPDLVIGTQDISLPAQVFVEQDITILATVWNRGSVSAGGVLVRFYMDGTQVGGDLFLASVPVGGSANGSIVWTAPAAAGQHSVKVKVNENGAVAESSTANNEAAVGFAVLQPAFGFKATPAELSGTGTYLSPARYDITLKNTGKNGDTVTVSASVPEALGSAGWKASAGTSVTVASGETKSVQVTVTPPASAAAGAAGRVDFTFASTGNSSFSRVVQTTTTVGHMAGANITPPPERTALPGESVLYDFTVANTGNDRDSYDLKVTSSMNWAPVMTGGYSTPSLDPGGKTSVQVQFQIPADTQGGARDLLTLTVTSKTNGSAAATASVRTTVRQTYGVSVTRATPVTLKVNPGDSGQFTLVVSNDGNGKDRISLNLTSFPPLPSDWRLDFETGADIKAGATREFVLSVQAGKDAKKADYRITVTATAGDGNTTATKVLTLSVAQVFGVRIEPLGGVASLPASAGKAKVVRFTVTNTGNGPDTFSFSVLGLSSSWRAAFSPSTLPVEAGKSDEVILTLTPPADGGGDSQLTVEARSDGDRSVKGTTVLVLAVKGAGGQGFDLLPLILLVVIAVAAAGAGGALYIKRKRDGKGGAAG